MNERVSEGVRCILKTGTMARSKKTGTSGSAGERSGNGGNSSGDEDVETGDKASDKTEDKATNDANKDVERRVIVNITEVR